MALTGLGLVEFAKSKIGTAYVYGMKGEVLTQERYDDLKKLYPEDVWDSDVNKVGQVCVDCSGLISWYTGVGYNAAGHKENAIKVEPISTLSQAPLGAILWQSGHVGVYAGTENGKAICYEAKGSAYGTVKSNVEGRGFTHWLLMDYITYSYEETTEVKTINVSINGLVKQVSTVTVDGNNYVKLQDLNNTTLGISYNEMPIISINDNQIEVKINGETRQVSAINIEGNNYIKLQDLNGAVISIGYDGVPTINVSCNSTYAKNYGNLNEDWKWVYDAVWDDSTAKAGCLLNKEDWPRYVYIWLYQGNYYATFFNYLFDRTDEFNNVKVSGYFWNVNRNLVCNSYLLDIVNHKILSVAGQSRSHSFNLAKHINTNSEELFNWLAGEDGEVDRSYNFNMCDTNDNGFWSNWGGFERNHFSGSYDWIMREVGKGIVPNSYRNGKYYVWKYGVNYYATIFDTFDHSTGISYINGSVAPRWLIDINTNKVVANSNLPSPEAHAYWAVVNIETCDSSMINYVNTNYTNKKDTNGNYIYPNITASEWNTVSSFNGFYK